MIRWRIASCSSSIMSRDKLTKYLEDGWEPFAVTNNMGDYKVWFRKQDEKNET